MKYDFTSYISRENTAALKTNQKIIKDFLGLNYYNNTIAMWVADMDFACAPEIVARLKNRADKLIFGYTKINDEYNNSIINWYKNRYNAKIEASSIVHSNGTVLAIKNAISALTNKGDEIIIQTPVYYPFAREILSTKRKVSDNKLLKDEQNIYSIDFADFENKCQTAKMFIFCNPHNPTGNIWSKEESQKLIDIANKYDVIVFSDEVHSDLIRCDKSFVTAMNLKNSENVIVGTAINKSFNLAGLQGTNLIIKNEKIRQKLNDFTGVVLMSPFTLEATIAAYCEAEAWLDELKTVLDHNFIYLDSFLKENLPKVKFNIPDGTYLAWLDFSAYNPDETVLLKKFADEAQLILESGSLFGDAGKGFIRLNLACPFSILQEALNRINKLCL